MAYKNDGYWSLGNDGKSVTRDEDFDEEDVWAVVKDRNEKDISTNVCRKPGKDASVSAGHRRLPSVSRTIPRANGSGDMGRVFQQSAPVNIPDWSKIYARKAPGGNGHGYGDWVSWVGGGYGHGNGDVNDDGGDDGNDEDDNEDDDDRIPPHEWIARKLARSQISSFSVCEGVGRTLKGRDLSKVRNAVLTRTGFLE